MSFVREPDTMARRAHEGRSGCSTGRDCPRLSICAMSVRPLCGVILLADAFEREDHELQPTGQVAVVPDTLTTTREPDVEAL